MKPVVIHEVRDGFKLPLAISAEIADRFKLTDGESVSQYYANQLRDASFYYEIGRNAAFLEMLGKLNPKAD